MSEKKPQTGEWWECDFTRVRIVGHRLDGVAITEAKGGYIGCIKDLTGWRNLPSCDSFEWQPETFPQWYAKSCGGPYADCDHIIRTSKNTLCGVLADGTKTKEVPWEKYHEEFVIEGSWIPLTQAEAESRVKKPEPVQSPDDWVIQDRVPDRPGIDQWRRVWPRTKPDDWQDSSHSSSTFYKHGDTCRISKSVFEVRCRRKDLPPLPQETPKPNYVRLWTHRTSGTVCTATDEKYLKYPEIWTELKHDGTGFYLADDGK
jgi:hypothetical protein